MKVISEYSRERLNTRRKAGSKAWLKARDRALSMIEVFSSPGAQRQAASGLPRRPCAATRGRVAKGLRALFMAARRRARQTRTILPMRAERTSAAAHHRRARLPRPPTHNDQQFS